MITIPTINELFLSIKSDLETSELINIPLIGKSVIRVFSAVQAAKLKLLYLVAGVLQKNIWPDTADPESKGGTLERYGRVKLGRDPFPPRAGQYVVQVSGNAGAVIASSTTFKSDDSSLNPGLLYVLDNSYTLTGSSDQITLRALSAGLDSKLNISDTLTATIPIANVDKSAIVTSELVEPQAAEDLEDYRTKILESFRLETQGGAATDYRLWSQDAQGVERVYPYAKSGTTSEINLFVEATIADSDDHQGTPSSALLLAVSNVVNFDPDTTLDTNERGRRPVNAIVNYLPVTILQVTIEIVSFVGRTTSIEDSIKAALVDLVSEIRPFVSAADILENKNDILDRNRIIAQILAARPGAVFSDVNLYINGVEENSFTFENGDIPFIDTSGITFI